MDDMDHDPSIEGEREFTGADGRGRKVEVYWDTQDPDSIGWAYRLIRRDADGDWGTVESGPIDSDDPWSEVTRMFPELND
jgi:hypothetical protein